ncbi:hypothetical protein A1D22_07615 [Pasteurellaceae bacterium LFhippo2]|nr:hypothetical protein [Pasteurellaceae bacterium LFhippo2]
MEIILVIVAIIFILCIFSMRNQHKVDIDFQSIVTLGIDNPRIFFSNLSDSIYYELSYSSPQELHSIVLGRIIEIAMEKYGYSMRKINSILRNNSMAYNTVFYGAIGIAEKISKGN